MKNSFLLASLMLSLIAMRSQAADVRWTSPNNISADTDIANFGSSVYAFDFGVDESEPRTATSINGVDFIQEQVNIAAGSSAGGLTQFNEPEGGPWINGVLGGAVQTYNWDRTPLDVFGSAVAATPFTNSSPALQELLRDAMRNNERPSTRATRAGFTDAYQVGFNLQNLTPGNRYVVQFFANDSRQTGTGRGTQFSDTAGNLVTLDANVGAGGVEGGLGQHVLGVFTADAANQLINVTEGVSLVVNALQVRELSSGNATIDWGTGAQDITGTGDVSTNGSLVYAYNFSLQEHEDEIGTNITTIGGVDFQDEFVGSNGAATGDFSLADNGEVLFNNWNRGVNYLYGPLGDQTPPPTTDGLDHFLNGGKWVNANPDLMEGEDVLSIDLTGLEAGKQYEVQLWGNDSRATEVERAAVWSDAAVDGNAVTIDLNVAEGAAAEAGNLGQYALGTFTAAGPSQRLYLPNGASPVLTALQLREVSVTGIDLIGDYNNNGIVDAADYTLWRDNLGDDASALENRDPANTGLVSQADYAAWKTNFGQSNSIVATSAVPEPASILLLTVVCGFCSLRKRNR